MVINSNELFELHLEKWDEIRNQLRGMKTSRLSLAMGIAYPRIQRILSGRSLPNWPEGQALIEFLERVQSVDNDD